MTSALLVRLGEGVRRDQDNLPYQGPSTDTILLGVRERERAHRRRVRAGFALAASLACGMFVAAMWNARAPHASPALGARTASLFDETLQFPDGTTLILRKGATANLESVGAHGARLRLNEGVVHVSVVHTEQSSWDVLAGPYSIHVTGTRFDAGWENETLRISMREGSVRVTGPCGAVALTAPDSSAFRCPGEERPSERPSEGAQRAEPPTALTTVAPEDLPKAEDASTKRPQVPLAPRHASRAITEPIAESAAPKVSASALLEDGDHERLAGRAPHAVLLYRRVRSEFPGTFEAAKAAFLLGRMAEAAGSLSEAESWYERAMLERGFEQESAGRLLELAVQRGDLARAAQRAEAYLRAHPGGPHRAYAESVLRSSR